MSNTNVYSAYRKESQNDRKKTMALLLYTSECQRRSTKFFFRKYMNKMNKMIKFVQMVAAPLYQVLST